jgi:hypothetical protein
MKRLLLLRTLQGEYKWEIFPTGTDVEKYVPHDTYFAYNDFKDTQNIYLIIRDFKKQLEQYALEHAISSARESNGSK